MKKNVFLFIVLVVAAALLSVIGWYNQNNQVPSPSSLSTIKAKAEKGDAKAQYNLGLVYAKGQGVKQDSTEAINWLERAGVQGNAKAAFILGEIYYTGTGTKKDYHMAAQWFDEACDNGSSEGCRMYQQLRAAGY
ncbi:MAG: tetratricopeptide repeat protein [Chlorobiaceae bacterium]